MNIDPQKISTVIVRDAQGNIINRFELGMIGVVTLTDKSKQLIIQQAKPKN